MTLSLAFISLPGGAEWLLILICIAVLFYWIRTITHVAKSSFESPTIKAVWLIVVIFLGILGAFIYDVAGRRTTIKIN